MTATSLASSSSSSSSPLHPHQPPRSRRWQPLQSPAPALQALGLLGRAASAGEGRRSVGAFAEPSLKLYNTALRNKQPFRPLSSGRVTFYSCGPTVYDFAHIGNFRAFLTYDLLKRWLLYLGYDVEHVCNLTDIDDKIIQRMARDDVSLKDLTTKYSGLFFEDLASLNIMPASMYPKATEHIDDIVEMISALIEGGKAYRVGDSVYFKTGEFPEYGTLSGMNLEGNEEGQGEGGNKFIGEKLDAKDFVLWKAHKEEDGDVVWDTPVGRGRPGWHIECSAMARKYLGDTIDLHAGGVDLVFPHHENERAQTEATTGKPMCNCWIHNGFVNINNEKMSKSLGNFLTLKQTFKSKKDVRAFRWLVISSQYRSPLNFEPSSLNNALKSVERLDKLMKKVGEGVEKEPEDKSAYSAAQSKFEQAIKKGVEAFEAGMNDDLNAPRAVAGLFQIVKAGEQLAKKDLLVSENAKLLQATLQKLDSVLGIFYEPEGYEEDQKEPGEEIVPLEQLSPEIREMIEERQSAKAAKDWAQADTLRDKLKDQGYTIVDQAKGELQVKRMVAPQVDSI